jgi:hypothetical protein
MKRMILQTLALLSLALFLAASTLGAEKVKSIKIAVENPTNVARPAADVVVSIPELRKIAPDFMPGSLIVTCTAASTLEQDAAARESTELPSQVDDLDQDGKADELVFQMDLGPRQARIVTIRYGEPDQIFRLRHDYPQRTNALFSSKIEGLGWESDAIAFRIYFDPRNAIDIYGKRRPTLQLRLFASPEYPYHEESPEGRDIFKVGDSIGIGGVAAWIDGRVVKVADVKERKWRIINLGPVRTIVELEYGGWNVGGKSITLRSRIAQWAGEHGFSHTIKVDPPSSMEFVTGFPVKHGIAPVRSNPSEGHVVWLATWGEQVVAPGPTATEAIAGQNLGLAVLVADQVADQPSEFADDHVNGLLRFVPRDGTASWFAMAAWDQENSERHKSSTAKTEVRAEELATRPPETVATQDAFLAIVKDQALRMDSPVKVKVLSAPSGH